MSFLQISKKAQWVQVMECEFREYRKNKRPLKALIQRYAIFLNPEEISQAYLVMIEFSLFNLLQLSLKTVSCRAALLLDPLLYQQVSH